MTRAKWFMLTSLGILGLLVGIPAAFAARSKPDEHHTIPSSGVGGPETAVQRNLVLEDGVELRTWIGLGAPLLNQGSQVVRPIAFSGSFLYRRVHLGEDHYHYEHVSGNSHHDHLICTACGGVIEFHDEQLEKLQMAICEKKKFTPTFHNLQILGICDSCRRKGQQPDAPDRVRMIQQTRLRK